MSERVRELERDWIGTGYDTPPAVRAMWFLSSVLVNHKPVLNRATTQKATVQNVRDALALMVSLGETAAVLLDELPPELPHQESESPVAKEGS